MAKSHAHQSRAIGILLLLAAWVLVLHGTCDLPFGGLWWLVITAYCLIAVVVVAGASR